jgi:hypothetical protein
MPIASSTCSYSNPLHWHNHAGTGGFAPLDSSDSNGTFFTYASSTCTFYGPATSTPPVYSGVFTAGDVVICLLLFVVTILQIIKMLVHSL